jgi:hypothetical protein
MDVDKQSMPNVPRAMYVGIVAYQRIQYEFRKSLGYVPNPLMVDGMPVLLMDDKGIDPNAVFISGDSGN